MTAPDVDAPSGASTDDQAPASPVDDAGATPADTDRPWRRALRAAGALFVISHLGYAVLYSIAFWSTGRAPALRNVLAPWNHWDSEWFTRIATQGYTESHCTVTHCSAAFFPLYPLLVHAVDVVLPGAALVAALTVSNVAGLAALALLYRLVERDFGAVTADRTTWYLIAFPAAFFLFIGYNESLFLLLSVACLYFLRDGRWLYAGLVGGLAAGTRSVGLLLLVPFCYEYLRQRGRRPGPGALAALLVPAGTGGYMWYLWHRYGDPLAFVHAQRQWGRSLNWPWVSFWQSARNLRHTHPLLAPNGAHLILELVAAVLVVALVVLAFVGPWKMNRDRWAYPLYATALTLTIICFPSTVKAAPFPLYSSPRLALEVFPAFVVLARVGAHRTADRLFLLVALAVQGAAIVQFLNGGWVS